MNTVSCQTCGIEFKITPQRLIKNKVHTCSKKCLGVYNSLAHSKKIKINCSICNKEIFYKKSHFKQIAKPCCSRLCSAKMRSLRNQGYNNPNSNNLNDIEKIFWTRTNNCRYRAESKNIDFDLDCKFLQNLFVKQQEKCYYSDVKMELQKSVKGIDFVFSVDRIDSSKGYTKDNVVLCTNAINRFKGEMDLETFLKFIKSIVKKDSNESQN